MGGYDRIRG